MLSFTLKMKTHTRTAAVRVMKVSRFEVVCVDEVTDWLLLQNTVTAGPTGLMASPLVLQLDALLPPCEYIQLR